MAAPVLVIDFGSQVTQLIARRVREAGVYCEIVPFQKAEAALKEHPPQAVILSGGPASVTESGSPRAPMGVFEMNVPVLGICYGEMTMSAQLGGKVEGGHNREFGRADIHIGKTSPLLAGLGDARGHEPVWMSHGDKITAIPPGFEVIATSESSPFAVIGDEKRRRREAALLWRAVSPRSRAHAARRHAPAQFPGDRRHQAGVEHACVPRGGDQEDPRAGRQRQGHLRVVGRRGFVGRRGADPRAIGDQLTCIFVDTGLMRAGEADEVVSLFKGHYNIR